MANRMIIVGLLVGFMFLPGCQEATVGENGTVNRGPDRVHSNPVVPVKISKANLNASNLEADKTEPMLHERRLQTRPSPVAGAAVQNTPRVANISNQPAGSSEPRSPTANSAKPPKIQPGPANRKKRAAAKRRTTTKTAPKTTPRAASTHVRVNAELLLRPSDIDDILGIRKGLDVHPLGGLQGTSKYDGIYWATKKGTAYVAGVQVWRPHSPIEAQRQYNDMLRSYPNVQESSAITNKTFLAHWNDLIYLAYMVPGKRTVISLTCHRKACKSPGMLVKLGERIKNRL